MNTYNDLQALLTITPPSKPRLRDSQRSKVYAAENEMIHNGGRVQWTDLADVQAWLDALLTSPYMQRKYGKAVRPIRLRPGRGARRAFAMSNGTITLPRWARHKQVVLHELAHIINMRQQRGSAAVASHGWEFCSVYLDLVRHVLGKQAHDELRQKFKQHRVKYTAPRRKRPLTEEQRAVLRERLATARAAKAAKAEPS